MSRMKRAWKIRRPKAKPKTYSTMVSPHMGRPAAVVTTEAKMMPVASPATQWMVDPSDCFHSGATNSSCVPGLGSLQDST